MKTKFTFLLAILFTIQIYAQLPDGSIAPDWTLDRVNTDCSGYGETWNLYTQLNAGKHVIIDFSAIWCGPCWNFHNGGTLETLWEDHGPNGDNTIRVFYIEADCGTALECLCDLPPCTNSQGNWLAGTAYPVFSPTGSTCSTITSGYDIGYYPTLYAINAEHKTVWEVGQSSPAVYESWLYESFTLEATVTGIQNDICGDGTGSISIEATGGKGNKSYLWSNGATTQDLTGVEEGTYWVKITDANGYFIKIENIEVNGSSNPLVLAASDIEHNTCYGSENGFIEVNTSGGVSPYSFEWSNGATTENIYNLPAGEYTLTVFDGNQCTKTKTFTIDQPDELNINASTFEASCGENNGAIFMNPNGGTPPYLYYFNGDYYTSGDFYDLAPGTYTVGINDYNSCEVLGEVVVTAIEQPVSNAGPDKTLPCSGGTVQLDGTFSSYGSNWGYLWTTTNGHIVSGANTRTPIVDAIGTYTLKVSDLEYGCVAFDNTLVTNSGNLPNVEIATPEILSCAKPTISLDGSGSASGSGITYNWTTTNGHIVSGANNAICIVDAIGTYTLAVTSSQSGCTAIENVNVSGNFGVPVASANSGTISCGQSSVEICINVTGQYESVLWANGSNNLCINVSAPGQYNYSVIGTNGCVFNGTTTVTGDNTLPVSNISDHGKLQCGATNINLTATGSTGTQYSYLWTTNNGHIVGANNAMQITVDQPGKYFFAVTNNETQCSSIDSTVVVAGPTFADAEFEHNVNYNKVILNGLPNAFSNSVWVSGGVIKEGEDAEFSFNENGTYTICHYVVNDCNGDTVCVDVVVNSILPLSFTSEKQNINCFGETNGSISVNAEGGIGSKTILWTGPNGFTSTNFTINALSAGTYTMVVTDEANHTLTQSFTISEPQVLAMTSNITNASAGQNNGAIDLTVSGGTSPYTYLWSNNATTEDISGLASGNYTVTIKDVNLCTKVETYSVGTTKTNETDKNLIYKLYPNPTNDNIFVELNSEELAGSEIKVTDITGKVILNHKITIKDSKIELNLRDYNSGVYMMKLENNKNIIVRKIVKL